MLKSHNKFTIFTPHALFLRLKSQTFIKIMKQQK